jgi:hypothetical protein
MNHPNALQLVVRNFISLLDLNPFIIYKSQMIQLPLAVAVFDFVTKLTAISKL